MKIKTNPQIVHAVLSNGEKYPFWEVIEGMGSLHLTYVHQREGYIIDAFEELTDRNYVLGCIMPTKQNPGLGIIVLQDGFRTK